MKKKMRQRVKATVKRGFIMRFCEEETWEEELEQMKPGEELVDGDAVPYYMETDDGTPWPEYYPLFAPIDGPRIFRVVEKKCKTERIKLPWEKYTVDNRPSEIDKYIVMFEYQGDLGLSRYLWVADWNGKEFKDYAGCNDIKKGARVTHFVREPLHPEYPK